MLLIGFKRIKIQPFDAEGTPVGDLIVLEGNENEGATQEATISGLSAEPVMIYGSNVAYYVSQRGTGETSVALTLLDMPNADEARVLGYKVDDTLKAQFVGEDTEPPYCGITLESNDAQGNTALFGFFRGKFSKGDTTLNTKEGSGFTPAGQGYTFSAVFSDREGKSKGSTMVKFLGTETEKEAIEELVFRTA